MAKLKIIEPEWADKLRIEKIRELRQYMHCNPRWTLNEIYKVVDMICVDNVTIRDIEGNIVARLESNDEKIRRGSNDRMRRYGKEIMD